MMEMKHGGFVVVLSLLLLLLSACLPCEGAPLHKHNPGDIGGGGDNDSYLSLSLVVSLTSLAALVLLLANCVTCCKEREINFKEFEDHFDDEIDFTPPGEDTPSMQSPAEVYTLAVPPVALPGPPHLDPAPRITEGSTGSQVARHSLSYIQEIGNGWFGKVLLSEIYLEPGASRVVVKELKANATAKEQNDFLQQGDPYRVLQHPNLLQCVGQCVEAIPFLLVFEYCEMGDLRSYLTQQDWMFRTAELLQLQRMACEIAAAVTHLHKHNFLHSDLALRNCYLTADLTVKVGDYGIGPYRYKEDYIITEDEVSAPLRWLAPELVGERHGGVVTMEQTKPANVWALGVTLWELLENAAQPYTHLSDREVLNHVIREQQIKPFKPQLELPYSDRWYEVLQFCWLSADKRATAEEVHRLLTYLRMQGQKDMEEDFEQRWDALKPNPAGRNATVSHSSYPILEQFAEDALRQEIDEVLTVTETSRGLSFEYVWEAAKHDHYDGSSHGGGGGVSRPGMDTTLNYHSMFFPASSEDIQAHFPDPASSGAARIGVENGSSSAPSGIPGVLPVFNSQKPGGGSEYYIQLEEQGEGGAAAGANGHRRRSDADTLSGRQEFVVLQDVRLDESSTDADFFHQSIDSKDSYLPDSHVWSSLENDSPYHTNIFTEGESKPEEESPSWRRGFMELPERNGNPFHKAPLAQEVNTDDDILGDSFLGVRPGAPRLQDYPEEKESADGGATGLLSSEKLAGNFLYLKEQSLMKEHSGLSGRSVSPQQNFLSPGMAHMPEESFRMSSWDNLESLNSFSVPDSHLKPVAFSPSPTQDLLDLPSPSSGDFYQPLVENQTLVPSITVITEDVSSNQLPDKNGSFADDFAPLHSSDTGIDSALDSLSERTEVPVLLLTDSHPSPPVLSESAMTESLCTDAKIPDDDDLGTSQDGVLLPPAGIEDPGVLKAPASPPDNGHSEGLTNDDLLSELIDDAEELEPALSDHEEEEEETFGDDDDVAPVGSPSLLVSGPSMDQISQDSLLDDSMPTADDSAQTPDSMDSLDIHRLGDGVQVADEVTTTTPVAPHKLQPPCKTADSGYETENLESPEWNSQPAGGVRDHSPSGENGVSLEEEEEEEAAAPKEPAFFDPTPLVPPEIVISEVENELVISEVENVAENVTEGAELQNVLEAEEENGEEEDDDQQPEPVARGEEPFMGGNYRDSAYFSDNESEPEKKPEETNVASSGSFEGSWPPGNLTDEVGASSSGRPVQVAPSSSSGSLDVDLSSDPSGAERGEPRIASEPLADVAETDVPPPPPNGSVGPQPGSTTAHNGEKEQQPDTGDEEGDKLDFYPDFRSYSETGDLPLSSSSSEEVVETTSSSPPPPPPPAAEPPSTTSAQLLPSPAEGSPVPLHAKLTRTYADPGPKIKEADVEGRYLGRREASSSPSGLDGQATRPPYGGAEDGGDADEENEENSEEDDSDDDMRHYRVHSSSSESEEEEDATVHPVPLIVSDDTAARNLKSLLKTSSSLDRLEDETTPPTDALSPASSHLAAGCDKNTAAAAAADNSRRAVSFFDDVTVYLFDQETPTKELGEEHGGASNSQVSEFSPVPSAGYLSRFHNSESSTDEEGGGFEWDDDFSSPNPSSFLSKVSEASKVMGSSSPSSTFFTPPSSNSSTFFTPPSSSSGRVPEPSWTSASSNYSRFSISPANIASFSITHLTDSDIEQGGSSEDGEKD